ncbi:MAG TPA: adenine phosphoribosyltransferase [Dehalococcoidia bacterium]|nr:adenine phosphoribosyltransferase [Dehalococcoidia bacterium]
MDLKRFVRDIPDFPRPGILFRDITPLLRTPDALREALDLMTGYARSRDATAVVGIESRGFLFGVPIAERLGLPFVPVRKPGKLPAARMSIEYSLEYGDSRLDIHADALAPGDRAIVVDDLLATGGTAHATCKLVELLGARVDSVLFLIELRGLRGRERLAGYDVHCVVQYE